jgi:hypothetical protein
VQEADQVPQRRVFADLQGHELEGQAKTGKDRGQGDQPSLGARAGPATPFRATKELDQGLGFGQQHLRTVRGHNPVDAFPSHPGVELLFIP